MPNERVIIVESGLATKAVQSETATGTATRVEGVESGPFRLVQLVEAGFPAELLYFVSGGPVALEIVSKATGSLVGVDNLALFTVTGVVIYRPVAVVGSAITSTSGTTDLAIRTADTAILGSDTVDNTLFPAGAVWVPGLDPDLMTNFWVPESGGEWFVSNGEDLSLVATVDDLTGGSMTVYLQWMAWSDGATIVAA